MGFITGTCNSNKLVLVIKMPEMSEDESDKLFVGALAWNTNETGLKEYFEKYGEVLNTVVMTDRMTLRSRGFGFVRFRESSSVSKVLEERPHFLDGREIDPKPCTPRDIQMQKRTAAIEHIRTHKIFIGGIAKEATEHDVQEYFEKFGEVSEVAFVIDENDKKHKGFGFVTFKNAASVDEIVSIHFHDIKGKRVEAKRAQPRDKMLTGTVRPPRKDANFSREMPKPDFLPPERMPPPSMGMGPSGGWMPRPHPMGAPFGPYWHNTEQSFGPQGHYGYGAPSFNMPDYGPPTNYHQPNSTYPPNKASSHGPVGIDRRHNSYHPYKR